MKEWKRYVVIVLVIISIALNSVSIRQNAIQINMVAKSVVILAENVTSIAINLTRLAKDIVIYKHITEGNRKNQLELFKTFVDCLSKFSKDVEVLNDNQIKLQNIVIDITAKPTFKYLRSVTVYIEAIEKTELDLLIEQGHQVLGKERELDHIKPQWSGTGVVVKVDKEFTYILTNHHVAGGENCYFEDGSQKSLLMISDLHKNRLSAEIVALHPVEDLALLKVKGTILGKTSIVGINTPTITEPAYTVGQSLGRPYLYGEGVFAGTEMEHDLYQLPVLPGCSGSGVFNKRGELTGLIYSIKIFGVGNGIPNYDITHANAVKSVYIKEFLEKYLHD